MAIGYVVIPAGQAGDFPVVIDPFADELRDLFACDCGVKRENVIAGNGSDDLLTMCFRAFTSPEHPPDQLKNASRHPLIDEQILIRKSFSQ